MLPSCLFPFRVHRQEKLEIWEDGSDRLTQTQSTSESLHRTGFIVRNLFETKLRPDPRIICIPDSGKAEIAIHPDFPKLR